MNVLVTGGAGYIGSHTCKELYRRGHRPVVIDNLSRGFPDFVKWGPLYTVDLHDRDKIREVLAKENIQAVIHFAAFAYVGESVEKPEMYYRNNVEGSLSLFQAMQSEGIKRIIFSSTCATYGIPLKVPIIETTAQLPINPYGETKLRVEKELCELTRQGKLLATALRYFNAAGGDPEFEIGESHEPETHLIPLALRAALDQKFSLSVYGNDYPTADGTCIRDYIHVADLARAHVLALEKLVLRIPGEWDHQNDFTALNLGTGRGYSVLDIIMGVERITGQKVKHKISPRRAGDPAELVADPDRAKRELNWRTEYSDLETILRTALGWYKKTKM